MPQRPKVSDQREDLLTALGRGVVPVIRITDPDLSVRGELYGIGGVILNLDGDTKRLNVDLGWNSKLPRSEDTDRERLFQPDEQQKVDVADLLTVALRRGDDRDF